ncbi:hypothetical protein BESB_065080 [Besnoitia besnoiti]|uniref:Transmembrane protein n=1 Tax=Besnoitia besnoiti TaxID=94643 RepID=A0A2A9MFV0_BESBE|nr:hypothetical protein BESB_065080 [Besnoitia besnoiti]PFH34477.1 hypothetical protein BESB_065080 [Besnoitia besnoiti]
MRELAPVQGGARRRASLVRSSGSLGRRACSPSVAGAASPSCPVPQVVDARTCGSLSSSSPYAVSSAPGSCLVAIPARVVSRRAGSQVVRRVSTFTSLLLLASSVSLALFSSAPCPSWPPTSAPSSWHHPPALVSALAFKASPEGPSAVPAHSAEVRREGAGTVEEALEEKYAPRNCKFRPLPRTLNEFAYLNYNGDITLGDVFGLPVSSILHEQRISFSVAGSKADASRAGSGGPRRAVLAVSVEMHRDNVTEFNHLELYKRTKDEKPQPALSASEAAAAADGAGAMQAALRRQQAVAVGRRVEGAGGPRTKVVLTTALNDEDGDTVFDLVSRSRWREVFSFRDSLGRATLTDGESNSHSPLLPCFPVRLDLALVPMDRAISHMPKNCPLHSSLPPRDRDVLKLGEEPLVLNNPPEVPFVFVYRNVDPWTPYTRAVWNMSIEVPRRLHRFVRLFFRMSFPFVSGPLQLLLELFDDKLHPDPAATVPQCVLGCMGGTPTFNGQLFDHAMPSGFTYKIWIMAGEPLFLEHHSTQCTEFDLEYKVNYEARLTPFEVGQHSWMCKFARLPGEFHQIEEREAQREAAFKNSQSHVGAVYARSLDLKDWFGFPPDEVDEMAHFINLHIHEASDIRVSLYQSNLRLRTSLTRSGADELEELCREQLLGGSDSGMVLLHCRVSPGSYRIALYAEYPLGGVPPCDGFYMHLTVQPLARLNERYGCLNRASSNKAQLPPLLISPTGPPPLAAPPASEDVIDLGTLVVTEEEQFRTFIMRMPPPPVQMDSAFRTVAKGRFSVAASLSQVYLHVALLSDFAAADLATLIRRDGAKSDDPGAIHVLAFSHDYQHLVGPLDAGDYTVEIVALSPATVDESAAKVAQALCIPFIADMRLRSRAGDSLHSATWLCSRQTPHLPRYIRGEEGMEVTLDKEFLLPGSGHQHLHVFIPRNSILKLHVHSAHSGEPRLSIYPKDHPQDKLAEAYTDLFLEADVEGEYIIRMHFPLGSTSLPTCPTVRLHLVLTPKASIPKCPWALQGSLSHEALKTAAEAHLHSTLDAGIFIPKRIAPHQFEVAAPRDFWLSPSLHPEFSFVSDSPGTSVRVEVVLHPPWLPAQLLLFKKDNMGLRRKPEAVSHVIQNRLLLLTTDVGPGEFLLQLKIYDEVDVRTEHLCAHATIHAEIGDTDEASVNALRAELLSLPDLMPIEPPLSSFNRRGWANSPHVFATSVFQFDTATPTTAIAGAAKAGAGGSTPSLPGAASGRDLVLLPNAPATALQVDSPTVLRIASEPAVRSRDKLLIRVFARRDEEASKPPLPTPTLSGAPNPPGAIRPEAASAGVVASQGGEAADALNFKLVEEADSSLLAVLQPGAYKIAYQAEGPFLVTIGMSSLANLREDLLYHPPQAVGGTDALDTPCLARPPTLTLPSPLPFYFESETFDIKLQPSFTQQEGELMTVPFQLTTPSVLYVEAGSNFLLDFVKVGVRVEEGTWIGEQRGRVNFLRLILDPGVHYLRILNAHANNSYKPEREIKSAIDNQRCLHFSLKIKVVAVSYAGPDADAEGAESCFSYGAMPLPLDLHSADGGSAALGGPVDANGRLLLRSKIVLTDANGGAMKRVAFDTKGKNLVMKLGVFSEERDRTVIVQVEDAHSLPVAPVHDWTINDGGYEKLFELDGQKRKYNALDDSSVFFLTFRVDRSAVAGAAPCAVFDLVLQVMPLEDKRKMSQCPASGSLGLPVVGFPHFFPQGAVRAATERSASFHTGLQQHVSTPLTAVREPQDGFLVEIPFTLAEESFILTEVHYNFFLSHIEIDVVEGGVFGVFQRESISFGELDFINQGRHPLNTRQWVATQLEPGNYVLRIADDHYGSHFPRMPGQGDPCFPLKFQFQVFSLASHHTRPTVIGIHPDPSLPVKYGQDLLILVRLSTPPSVAGQGAEASDTARRSAYLFGKSGFTLHATHFANLDSFDEAYEERLDFAGPAQAGQVGGVVWSFLFTADKLQRLGNSAKFVLEFTSKHGGEPYTFGILRSGVRTPDGTDWSSSDEADYVTEVNYTFLSPGALRENTPWASGDLAPYALPKPASSSSTSGDVRAEASQATPSASGPAGAAYSREQEAPRTSTRFVRQEDGGSRPPVESEVVRELERVSLSPAAAVSDYPSRAPLIPPKISRDALLIEDDEASEARKPPRTTPWDAADEDGDGFGFDPYSRSAHPLPPGASDEAKASGFHRAGKRRKEEARQARRKRAGDDEEDEDLGCDPGMIWNDVTNECEDAGDDEGPAILLLFFVSAIGVVGLLLLSRYVLRRRTKSDPRSTYRIARVDSANSDTSDFLPRRSGSGFASSSLSDDDEV